MKRAAVLPSGYYYYIKDITIIIKSILPLRVRTRCAFLYLRHPKQEASHLDRGKNRALRRY